MMQHSDSGDEQGEHSRKRQMTELHVSRSSERIMETMIDLTGLSKSQRVIAAGSDAFDIYLALHHRGFSRVATPATCRIPCGQHDVALVAGEHSIKALEELLVRIVAFLNTRATVAVWVDSDGHRGTKLSSLLNRLGFRIAAGAKCENGFVLSARRHETSHVAKAA
jgi:hypothetical protein